MKNLIAILILLLLPFESVFAQENNKFKLTINSDNSFYDSLILKQINLELSKFSREFNDSAFVFIEDQKGLDVTVYILIKRYGKSKFYMMVFNSYKKEYFFSELKMAEVKIGSIGEIFKMFNDSAFYQKRDPFVSTSAVHFCNIYVGFEKKDYEFQIHASNLMNDERNLLSFITGVDGTIIDIKAYSVFYYFTSGNFKTTKNKPPTIIRYRKVKYGSF